MKKSCVVVVGSSNTDLVIQSARLPKPGETILGGQFERFNGGKGANQAVAAARGGAKVSFIGAHGYDDFGLSSKRVLSQEGIDVRHFRPQKHLPSGVALILVGGKTRENMIAVSKSANGSLSPGDIKKAGSVFKGCQAVVCQLEIPLETVQTTAELAARRDIPFILNPAPGRPLPVSLLKKVHTLTPNEHEAAILTGASRPKKAAQILLKRGCRNVVVTMGAAGALMVNKNIEKMIPAPKVQPVDTVGAGDCFTAWISLGIAEGLSFDETVKRAVRAASLSVTRIGAQTSMPYRLEVIR